MSAISSCNNLKSDPFVKVSYEENLSHDELISKVSKENLQNENLQVVMWYIGSHGLKEDAVKFYKQKMRDIQDVNPSAKFWLLDLTAWGALSEPNAKITSSSRCGEKINAMKLTAVKCISCADIFKQIQEQENTEIVKYFSGVASRPDLLAPSSLFEDRGIKIGDVFKDCPMLEPLYTLDAAKCYSTLQYIEGAHLINEIAGKVLSEQSKCNIAFILPNDESKYYRDEKNSFAEDAGTLMKHTYGHEWLDGKSVDVKFLNFKFGEEAFQRPYNAGKKVIKKVNKEDIL